MDTFTFALRRTPWGTPWYGNFGGEVLSAGLAVVPPEGLTRAQAEDTLKQMMDGVEQQWRNHCEEKKLESRGRLGVAGIFEIVSLNGSPRVDAAA